MTDKTLGAYQRPEKHDAADFANAEFARHPDGRTAMQSGPDLWKANVAGERYNTRYRTNGDMVSEGWSPVRECPDPDEHVRYDAALADAEKAERERDEARGALRARLGVLAEPRPLTPDAITDTAMRRAVKAWEETGELRPAIFAALTTPARPEGAEDIDEHLRQANAAALGGALTPEQRRALADHLAGFGYRNPIALAEVGLTEKENKR